jgi:hypothetical protein
MTWLTVLEIFVTNDHGYVPLVIKHFPVPSSFMTYHRFVTRLTRRVPLVEQKLFTLPEHLSSSPVFSRVRVTRSLVLYVCLIYKSLFVLLYFFFWPLCCLLRYADSDYSLWCIFKPFLTRIIACTVFSFEGFVSVPKNAYKTLESFT